MEIKDYCTNVSAELMGWKDRVEGVVRKLDHASTGDKKGVVSEVNELHIIADELGERIEGLTQACMTSWQPQRPAHDVIWPEQTSRAWDDVSQSDFGG